MAEQWQNKPGKRQ